MSRGLDAIMLRTAVPQARKKEEKKKKRSCCAALQDVETRTVLSFSPPVNGGTDQRRPMAEGKVKTQKKTFYSPSPLLARSNQS